MKFLVTFNRFTDEDDIEPKYCEATEICCGLPETDTSTSFEPNELPECGHRNINVIESRISGGGFAQYSMCTKISPFHLKFVTL